MILYINIPRTIFFASRSEESLSALSSFAFSLEKHSSGKRRKPGKNEINVGECRKTAEEFSSGRRIREHWPQGTFFRSGSCIIGAWAEGAGSLRGRSRSGRGSARGKPAGFGWRSSWIRGRRRSCRGRGGRFAAVVPAVSCPGESAGGPAESGRIAGNGNGRQFYTMRRNGRNCETVRENALFLCRWSGRFFRFC